MSNLKHHDSGHADKSVVQLPRRAFRRGVKRIAETAAQPNLDELSVRLRRFGLFSKLSPATLAALAAWARVRECRAGEFIWHQGEPNQRALFIEQGLVKTSRRNPAGVSRTYGLHGPGDSMGIYAIWAGKTYPTDAVALSDGMTALEIDSAALVELAGKSRLVSEKLLVEIGRFTEAFIHKIDIVSAGTVPRRLAALMTLLVERYGMVDDTPKPVTKSQESPAAPRAASPKAGPARLPISLTLEHISEIVDARIETVARVFSAWKRQGWLKIDANGCEFAKLEPLYAILADS